MTTTQKLNKLATQGVVTKHARRASTDSGSKKQGGSFQTVKLARGVKMEKAAKNGG